MRNLNGLVKALDIMSVRQQCCCVYATWIIDCQNTSNIRKNV